MNQVRPTRESEVKPGGERCHEEEKEEDEEGWVKDLVKGIIDSSAIQRLRQTSAECFPRQLVWSYMSPLARDTVHPLSNAEESAVSVSLTELISLRPAQRSIAKALMYNSVEPSQ